VGHFDLIVVDEAHRSIYQKYRAIFSYFDALLVGLTATPKDEIDRNTYSLFGLESGVPTDAYGLDDAIAEGYLVPPRAVSVPLKFQREGIRYDDLSDDEKDQWDALEWDEKAAKRPTRWSAEAVNQWLFNTDTVDKMLALLMSAATRWRAATGWARPSSLPRTSGTPSSSRSASTPTTRNTGASLRGSSPSRPNTRRSLIDAFLAKGPRAAHRHFGGHAGHRHRRARGGEPGVLQDRALQGQVLADGGARHAAVQRAVRAGAGQEGLLHLRLLPEPGVFQPGRLRG
jgi:hypothetical protein